MNPSLKPALPTFPKVALNRTTRDLRELALPYAIKGVAQLAAIAANVKNDPSDRIMAIRELLDRAYGKPSRSTPSAARAAPTTSTV